MAEIMTKDVGFIADPFPEKARSITFFTGPAVSGTRFPLPDSYGTAHAGKISIKYTYRKGVTET
jgi:hypothetical protein